MNKKYVWWYAVGLLLLAYIIMCRYSTPVADYYAFTIYPTVSCILSFISSFVPFSLQESFVVGIIAFGIALIPIARRRKWSFGNWLSREFLLVLWTFVWFYISWCNNYSRSNIFARTECAPKEYDQNDFYNFASGFIDSINLAWTPDSIEDYRAMEEEIKAFYSAVHKQYGLAKPRSWHHPKPMLFEPIYSAVGVAGFMSPLFSESCVNSDMLKYDIPGVYAHEYSHLLGVSSEAEANWWAFQVCTASANRAIKYSGYWEVFPHVLNNARRLLPESEYKELVSKLRPEIIADNERSYTFYSAKHFPVIQEIRSKLYDIFLKSNSIPSGRKNYSEVVLLMMSLKCLSLR